MRGASRVLSGLVIAVVVVAASALAQDGDDHAAPPPAPLPPTTDDPWPGRVLPFEASPEDRAYLGTGFTGAHAVPDGCGFSYGVRVAGVQETGALHRAGLRDGDVIVALAGQRLDDGPREEAIERMREVLKPLAPDSQSTITYTSGDAGPRQVTFFLGRQPPSFARDETPEGWFESRRNDPALLDWIDRATALDDGIGRYRDTLARQRKRFAKQDVLRLRETVEVQLNPAAQERAARDVAARIADDPVNAAWLAAGRPPVPVKAVEQVAAKDLEDELDRVERFLVAAASRIDAALGWSAEERTFVEATLPLLTERFAVEGEYMYGDEDVERERDSRRAMQLIARVDRAAMAHVAAESHAFVRSRLDQWIRLISEHGGQGVVASRDTPVGRIELVGPGRQTHKTRCALRVDLGGNDRYLDCAARADASVPISILVELGGHDVYGATAPFSQAGAVGGVALLLDGDGDDQYLAAQWGQAAAVAGFALLRDADGRDTYRGNECCQGVALAGAAVLVDDEGDDTYASTRYSQGVGLPGGVGALLDTGGNDRYAATGRYGSEYGEDGVFSGWSQGVGFGFRRIASGGIGVLADTTGDDIYEAGNFSQGGGYFHAWGILADGGGDDRYIGSRYAQGYAAHQASGTFLEDGGDDLYQSHAGVAQGLSWDETTVLFRDRAGNDTYETRGFSLASAAHNGIVLFLDDAGTDTYADRPSKASSNAYHGGHSFALFLDRGGDEDTYGKHPPRGWNDRVSWRHDGAYALDLPAAIPDALSDLARPETDKK